MGISSNLIFFKVEEIFDIFDDDGNEPQGEGPYPFMVS